MMNVMNAHIFPAKLLLFGEYSILLGSSALSMPFPYFSASLKIIDQESGELLSKAKESNRQLEKIWNYFGLNPKVFSQFLDLESLRNDIGRGLYLESTIPQRYGMGSSGALCAAVYGGYHIEHPGSSQGPDTTRLVLLRNAFIQMESYFHGKSSGFDPLVSSLNTPLMLTKEGQITPVDFHRSRMSDLGIELLLVDSGQPCSTGPLVTNFLAEYAPDGIATSMGKEICNLANSVIEKLLTSDTDGLWDEIIRLSKRQLTNLIHLVPDALRPLWAEGLQSGLFTLKLCGSGGGGFLICFTREKDATIKYFNDKNKPVIAL
ncbi:MAG: hypothetical protein WCK09_03525 [Bacteroidota bacterium]